MCSVLYTFGRATENIGKRLKKPEAVCVNPELVFVNPKVIYVKPEVIYVNPEVIYVKPELVYVNPEVIYVKPEVIYIGSAEKPQIICQSILYDYFCTTKCKDI